VNFSATPHVDPLTLAAQSKVVGRPNLPRLVERAQQDQQILSLLVLDIDNFKRFNDQHGHISGDRASARGAGVQGNLRSMDIAARYGARIRDCAPDDRFSGARAAAERLRVSVNASTIEPLTVKNFQYHDSVGVAVLQNNESSLEFFLAGRYGSLSS